MNQSAATKRIVLTFSGHTAGQPVITELVRRFDLQINIYRARITPNEEGYMAIDITGSENQIEEGLKYISTYNITISETENSLVWDSSKCTGCGNCIPHCPTEALYIADEDTREVKFSGDKCIECLSCIKNCPFDACSSLF